MLTLLYFPDSLKKVFLICSVALVVIVLYRNRDSQHLCVVSDICCRFPLFKEIRFY